MPGEEGPKEGNKADGADFRTAEAETFSKGRMQIALIWSNNLLHCDDSVGPKVADAIGALHLPNARTVVCRQLSLEHAEPIFRVREVVFVAAAVDVPLEVQLRKLQAGASSQLMAHAADPRTMLVLARNVFGHCAEAWWLTIPAVKLDFGHDLSPTAQRGLETAV